MNKIETANLAQSAIDALNNAQDNARKVLCDIINAHGGFIKTDPTTNPRLVATVVFERAEGENMDSETIYGVRCDKENNITLCILSKLRDYEYDNDYRFESDYYFEGEDAEELDKLLADEAYFMDLDDEYIHENFTVFSILCGISNYVE